MVRNRLNVGVAQIRSQDPVDRILMEEGGSVHTVKGTVIFTLIGFKRRSSQLLWLHLSLYNEDIRHYGYMY